MSKNPRPSINQSLMANSQRLSKWLNEKALSGQYDLTLVDGIFGVFAGASLSIALVVKDWGAQGSKIIVGIVISGIVILLSMVVTINQKRAIDRLLGYGICIIFSISSVPFIKWVALNDLSSGDLMAVPIGVGTWIVVREFSVLLLNLLAQFNIKSSSASKNEKPTLSSSVRNIKKKRNSSK